ncbi:MAG: hypothetical protein AB7P34_15820 [Vicinamibacterales bacterium]
MPTTGFVYDKSCPKCPASGEAIKATTGQRDTVIVDLRCTSCGHTWVVTLTTGPNT